MSDQLQKSAEDLLDAARMAGQNALTFIQQQAPDVCKQLVNYKLIDSLIPIIASFLMIIICLFIVTKCWKKIEEDKDYIIGVIVPFLIILICFIPLFSNLSDVLQCIYTPKAVLFKMIFKN